MLTLEVFWTAVWMNSGSVTLLRSAAPLGWAVRRWSVSVAGGVLGTVAILVRSPVAFGSIAAVTMKVTVPPGKMVTFSLMAPEPLASATLEPADAVAVQLKLVIPAGMLSVTN